MAFHFIVQPNARELLTDGSAHIFFKDSGSNAGIRDTFYTWSGESSSVRSSTSPKVRSAEKKAALEVKVETLQRLHKLQIQEFQLKQRKAQPEIQGEIEESD